MNTIKSSYNNNSPIYYNTNNSNVTIPERKSNDSPCIDLIIRERTNNRFEDSMHDINEFDLCLNLKSLNKTTYLEIKGNDNLLKMGYYMPHPLIIDNNYNGNIIIKLIKYKECSDLNLPFVNGLYCTLHDSNLCYIKKNNNINNNNMDNKSYMSNNIPYNNIPKNNGNFFL